MQILIDADACPGIIKSVAMEEASSSGIKLTFICSTAHYSNQDSVAEFVIVDNYSQAADLAIANRVKAGDIVITGDYGLAAMVLGKGANAISIRGYLFTPKNIDELLWQRHVLAKVRKGGGRHKGPAKITATDVERFRQNLQLLVGDIP